MVMTTLNGFHPSTSHHTPLAHANGHDVAMSEEDVFSLKALEDELTTIDEGVVPLGILVQRVVQACYAELQELHETLPTTNDHNRKHKLANFVVTWKRHIAKVYAVAKWSRDAEVIKKCMSIIAFLGEHNTHFTGALEKLGLIKDNIEPVRHRNHDLLTSLDVLTTGTYRRLPSRVKRDFIQRDPLSDEQVARTLVRIEAAIRYRLRMDEVIPVEMSSYRIYDGRAFFTVPGLFETSICVLGQEKSDMWFFSDVRFLFTVGGEVASIEDFPTEPTGPMLQHIADEADRRMGIYRAQPPPEVPEGMPAPPPPPELPEGSVDAPLVRLFNFLQMMSLSYQLEVLFLQAQRLRSLGWAEYLRVQMSADRHTLTLSYWVRKPPPSDRPAPRFKLPSFGGTVTISLVASTQLQRKPKARILAELQARSRLEGRTPSDDVESMRWEVKWEPQKGALGVQLLPEDSVLGESELLVDPADLDVEKVLRAAIHKHTRGIWKIYIRQLKRGSVFAAPDAVVLVPGTDGSSSLRVFLCADEMVFVSLDARTGLINLRDTGDLGVAGRAPRFMSITDKLNENPAFLLEALVRLRLNTIVDIAEQKANYLGLQTFRTRNMSEHDMVKFGNSARASLYVQLEPYPTHYLVLVVADDDFRYALISTSPVHNSMYQNIALDDIGWLDISRICSRPTPDDASVPLSLGKRKRDESLDSADSRFKLETSVLRELYAYCCARVSHTKVENQFKNRGIPYAHVFPPAGSTSSLPSMLSNAHSALSAAIPALCVQSSDILAGSQAYEAAMPNIRVIPLAWWSASAARAGEKPPQVVTCVKLKYVQQPVGRRAGTDPAKGVIRPSKRIVYDANEAVVCFLADQVEGCVDMFLKEWTSVSKIVVMAREVAQMAKRWKDVRLLSFDLQTVEFAYASDYVVSVTGDDPSDPAGGSFNLHFARIASSTPPPTASSTAGGPTSSSRRSYNPHSDAEPFFMDLLRNSRISACLPALVDILRNTVPIVEALEEIRSAADAAMDLGGAADAEWSWADVDTFPKAAGWWRACFGHGAQHALDLRLMQGARIAVVDASYIPKVHVAVPVSASASAADDPLLLRPIPNFNKLVETAIKDYRPQRRGSIARTDVGVVCDVADAAMIARRMWEGVLREFGITVGAGSRV